MPTEIFRNAAQQPVHKVQALSVLECQICKDSLRAHIAKHYESLWQVLKCESSTQQHHTRSVDIRHHPGAHQSRVPRCCPTLSLQGVFSIFGKSALVFQLLLAFMPTVALEQWPGLFSNRPMASAAKAVPPMSPDSLNSMTDAVQPHHHAASEGIESSIEVETFVAILQMLSHFLCVKSPLPLLSDLSLSPLPHAKISKLSGAKILRSPRDNHRGTQCQHLSESNES